MRILPTIPVSSGSHVCKLEVFGLYSKSIHRNSLYNYPLRYRVIGKSDLVTLGRYEHPESFLVFQVAL
jgi:hypothetical protein